MALLGLALLPLWLSLGLKIGPLPTHTPPPLGPPASLLGIGPTSCPWSQGKEVVGALERMEQSSLNKGQWPGGSQPKPETAAFGMLYLSLEECTTLSSSFAWYLLNVPVQHLQL